MPLRSIMPIVGAVVLFAMASPVVKLLAMDGGKLGLKHPEVISFCNLLFVGNLCAGLLVLGTFGTTGILRELRDMTVRLRLLLLVGSILAALYPGLIYTALERTSVTSVVLLSRFESILIGVFAAVFWKVALKRQEILGFVIIGGGVLALVFVQEMYTFHTGDLYVLVAAVVYASAVILAKEILKECSVRVFLFVRNFFSAIIFLVIGLWFYGAAHFVEAFTTGELWITMTVYALFIIVIGQALWYRGIAGASPVMVSNLTLVTPFLTLGFAYLLLNEVPDHFQAIAIGLILTGMVVSKLNVRKPRRLEMEADKTLGGG